MSIIALPLEPNHNPAPDGSPEDRGQTDGGSSWGVLVAVHPDQGPRRCKRHLGFF